MSKGNKKLQYTPRVSLTRPREYHARTVRRPSASFGGGNALFLSSIAEDDVERKELLFGVPTKQLSHLQIIGSVVAMLDKALREGWSKPALREPTLTAHSRKAATATPSRLLTGAEWSLRIRRACLGGLCQFPSATRACDLRSNNRHGHRFHEREEALNALRPELKPDKWTRLGSGRARATTSEPKSKLEIGTTDG